MREISENIWHGIDAREAAAALDTHETDGLSEQAVNDRAAAFGPNELTRKKGQGPVTRFLLQLWQPLVIILVVSAGITFFLEEYVDAAVIGAVVLVNAVVGFVQEAKAVRAIEALARAMTSEAVVIRGGVKQHIDARRLVPGDVVLLQSGDKVPADLRLVFTRELQIDE
ncbi:MAG: cation-transporting P-type ATPase, partial [Thermodesulfobacteriota bacterium]